MLLGRHGNEETCLLKENYNDFVMQEEWTEHKYEEGHYS
jgi:hypothetical protein